MDPQSTYRPQIYRPNTSRKTTWAFEGIGRQGFVTEGDDDAISTMPSWIATAKDHGEEFTEYDWIALLQEPPNLTGQPKAPARVTRARTVPIICYGPTPFGGGLGSSGV